MRRGLVKCGFMRRGLVARRGLVERDFVRRSFAKRSIPSRLGKRPSRLTFLPETRLSQTRLYQVDYP